eukprot:COSAG01_NODE_1029_length_12019_cov_560.144631_11_plen_240_part_00
MGAPQSMAKKSKKKNGKKKEPEPEPEPEPYVYVNPNKKVSPPEGAGLKSSIKKQLDPEYLDNESEDSWVGRLRAEGHTIKKGPTLFYKSKSSRKRGGKVVTENRYLVLTAKGKRSYLVYHSGDAMKPLDFQKQGMPLDKDTWVNTDDMQAQFTVEVSATNNPGPWNLLAAVVSQIMSGGPRQLTRALCVQATTRQARWSPSSRLRRTRVRCLSGSSLSRAPCDVRLSVGEPRAAAAKLG